jgi:hypothetical protein
MWVPVTHCECDMTLYKPYSVSWCKIVVVVIPPLDVPEIEVG